MKLIEKLLKIEEGFRPYAYQDSLGFWTIGYGTNIDRNGGGLTEEECQWILERRLEKLETVLNKELPWFSILDPVRHAVVLSMAYQMGVEGLLKFRRTLDAMQQGRYDLAADYMLQSRWATQTPERAQRAARAIRTGESQWS